ncbi:hypothetical protein [Nonomuraea africana]|uniref:Uncharacterized protein n=1 Tax=Nonomuraea africana TaxID=46171 RepID=A0ABR9KS64_9ACTN|nr:hypothetical protein [Nonomuraea africana]MBE1564871.1 hypothetical protein [Nonomuraea africana]
MSKQLTFTIACAAVLSAVIPGAAGYFSARLEAVEAAEQRVAALQQRLVTTVAKVSLPRPCGPAQTRTRPEREPVPAAFVPAPETPKSPRHRWPREDLPVVPAPEWNPAPITPADAAGED